MNKLYNPIDWENGTTPAINEDNLNAISQGLSDVDDRVIELAGDIVSAASDCNDAVQAASNYASTAASSATTATTKAGEAANSATTASNKATEAAGYASNASSSASDALGYKEDAEDAAESAGASAAIAEAASLNPPYIGENDNWYTYDTEEEAYVDTGVDATGEQGPPGFSPEIVVTSITGGHRVKIIDEDHPTGQSFDVMDGSGAGNMVSNTYDPNLTVANAGGIPGYVADSLAEVDVLEDFSKYNNAVNIKDYGAVGDGVTNDLAAFKAAFNNNDNYDVILIPRGTYVLTQDLEPGELPENILLCANKTIVGESSKLTIIKDASIVAPYGITAKSITFDGGTQRYVYEAGFPAGDSNYGSRDKMQWKKVTIFATPQHDDASVVYENCVFKNTDIASLAFYGSDSSVTPPALDANAKPLVESNATGCVFENITNCGIWHSVNIGSAKYIGNTFRNFGGSSIVGGKVWPLSLGDISNLTNQEVTDAYITDNMFDTLLTGVDLETEAFIPNTNPKVANPDYTPINANFIAIVCERAFIGNNFVKDLLGYGHDREGIYTKGNDVEITNNFLIECSAGGEGYICAKHKAFNLSETRVMNIHNNTFHGTYGNAIRCYGTGVIRNNDISISKMWRAVRGTPTTTEEMPDHTTPRTSLVVEGNTICCGIGSCPDDPNYAVDNAISVSGEYYGGLYFNDNSMSFYKALGDESYVPSAIKVQNVAGDVIVKGNIVHQDVIGIDAQTVDTALNRFLYITDASSTGLTASTKANIQIVGNQIPTVYYNAVEINVTSNAYLHYIFDIVNNYIQKVIRTQSGSGAYPYFLYNRGSNTDIVYYESNQPNRAMNQYVHMFTTASEVYSTLSSDFFYFGTTPTTVFHNADIKDYALVSDHSGTASATATSVQRVGNNGAYTEIDGTKYMEQIITLSTSASVTATFTNAAILATSAIEVFAGRSGGDVSGSKNAFPFVNIYTTDGSCAVTFPKESSSFDLKVRIYIR